MLFNKKHTSEDKPSDYDVLNNDVGQVRRKRKKPFRYVSDYKGRMFYEAPNYFNLKPAEIT